METPLFEEEQEIRLLGPISFLSGAAFFVSPLFTEMPLWLVLFMFACGIGMSMLMRGFMKMHTRVTMTTLSFGPQLWTKRFPAAEVEVIGPRDIPFMAGVGIHRFRGRNYYNMRLGQGLEIKHHKRVFVIGSAKLTELQMALKEAQRSARG